MRATVNTFNNRKPYLAFPPLPDMKEATPAEVKDWYQKYRTWYDDLVKILQKDREELNKVIDTLSDTNLDVLADRVGTLEDEVTADGADISDLGASVAAVNTALMDYVTRAALDGMFSGEQLGKKLVDYNNLINVPATAVTRHYQFKAAKATGESTTGGSPETINQLSFTETYDPYNVFASDLFTVPVTGYYHLAAGFQVSRTAGAGTMTTSDVILVDNSSTNIDYGRVVPDTATVTGIYTKTEGDHYLTSGTTVKVSAKFTWGGGATTWQTASGTGLNFSGFLIEAT